MDPEVERQHEYDRAEALIRSRKKMELFDSLPEEVRRVLTECKVGGGLEDLQHLQCMVLYSDPKKVAKQLVEITDRASAERFRKEQLDLERFPIQWKWKKAPV